MNYQDIQKQVDAMSDSEVVDKLNELSETFKPKFTGLTLNPNDNSSFEKIARGYCCMIMALKILAESGCDEKVAEELGFKVSKYSM